MSTFDVKRPSMLLPVCPPDPPPLTGTGEWEAGFYGIALLVPCLGFYTKKTFDVRDNIFLGN
jgi:hypothetical protein